MRGFWVVICGALASGCGGGGEEVARYPARGVVEDVNREYAQVLIDHEDIEGLMPAMTMSFDVPDAALLEGLERGQTIDFVVAFDGHSYRVVEVSVREAGSDQGSGGLEALAALRTPAPQFELLDQAGLEVASSDLLGQVLLVDFIYTSCPGPCPILTGRHVSLQRSLSPDLRERTRFVSVSIDPERDTPAALRAYAEARGADLAHWSFLTGPPEAVAAVVAAYGVGTLRQPDGSIEHIVATFVVDKQGRIAERFIGLEHDLETLKRALERAASG
jgi:protein SCO1/2